MPADAVQSAYVISYIEFVNRVAEAIAKSHPKVMVGPLIYSQTDRAMPDGCPALADNVLLGLAHICRDSYRPLIGEPKSAINLRFLGNDLTWIAKAKHAYIYEYYNGWIAPYIYPGAQVIVRDLQTLHAAAGARRLLGHVRLFAHQYVRGGPGALVARTSPGRPRSAIFAFVTTAMWRRKWRRTRSVLRTGIFGLNGYQANGARDPESPTRPASWALSGTTTARTDRVFGRADQQRQRIRKSKCVWNARSNRGPYGTRSRDFGRSLISRIPIRKWKSDMRFTEGNERGNEGVKKRSVPSPTPLPPFPPVN